MGFFSPKPHVDGTKRGIFFSRPDNSGVHGATHTQHVWRNTPGGQAQHQRAEVADAEADLRRTHRGTAARAEAEAIVKLVRRGESHYEAAQIVADRNRGR